MATQETPVRVKRSRRGGHLTESRWFARENIETFCVQKGCRFYGQHAAQGVCHSRLKTVDMRYLERVEKRAEELIRDMQEIRAHQKMTAKQYIKYLEGHLLADWMNGEFKLDELIRLRAQNSVLTLRKKGKR